MRLWCSAALLYRVGSVVGLVFCGFQVIVVVFPLKSISLFLAVVGAMLFFEGVYWDDMISFITSFHISDGKNFSFLLW